MLAFDIKKNALLYRYLSYMQLKSSTSKNRSAWTLTVLAPAGKFRKLYEFEEVLSYAMKVFISENFSVRCQSLMLTTLQIHLCPNEHTHCIAHAFL